MADSKIAKNFWADPSKEFAAFTGSILTGINARPTVTGWSFVVKRLSKDKVKEVLFIDAYSYQQGLDAIVDGAEDNFKGWEWRPDKY